MNTTLTEQETRILRFEKRWWRQAGAKDAAVRNQFGVSVTRYYQQLNRLLDNPAALAAEPAVVKRLRSVRDQGVTGLAANDLNAIAGTLCA